MKTDFRVTYCTSGIYRMQALSKEALDYFRELDGKHGRDNSGISLIGARFIDSVISNKLKLGFTIQRNFDPREVKADV